jgi:gamma-glutamyltranspeptidase/glutathione hydrolase
VSVPAGIAAGHPATAAAGLEVLADGGTAADAAVAAILASCVAETVMTGLAGGGHAVWWDAERRAPETVDFFVTVPGLDAGGRAVEMVELEILFGTAPVVYSVGVGSCGVPGVPAGCDALWRRWGRLPWPRLVEPALRLARAGVVLPHAHAAVLAMIAPVLTMGDGAGIYAPEGRLLAGGEKLDQPGLVCALELLRDEGAASFYSGTVAGSLLGLVAERGGILSAADLRAYRVEHGTPVVAGLAGLRVAARRDLNGTIDTLGRLPTLAGAHPAERALAFAAALAGVESGGDTTNLTVVDAAGNACVATTSLGVGSGDFLPGLDVHLNSMLGESELLRGHLEPGGRMASMMAPCVAHDHGMLVAAAGAAGGSRIRSALVQVLSGVLGEGLDAAEAVRRPRLHPVAPLLHAEPGFDEDALDALEAAGYDVRRWETRHHYFGGVSLVSARGAAGDPRRDGVALLL